MNDTLRGYFWAYDIFGYLLPGLVLMALLAAGNETVGKPIIDLWTSNHWQNVFVVAGFAYVVGHVIAAASSWALERHLLKNTLGWPTQRMFGLKIEHKGFFTKCCLIRFLLRWGVTPILLWVVPDYGRAYSPSFQKTVRDRMRDVIPEHSDDFHDWFWLVWNYVAHHHPVAHKRATHFLELYGFSRNLAMTLLGACLLPFLNTWKEPLPRWMWITLCLGSAVLLFSNYAKLLRRLNDEVYRAFVSLSMRPPAVATSDSGPTS